MRRTGVSRLMSLPLAWTLVSTSIPHAFAGAAEPVDPAAVEQLYAEGQEREENRDFAGAAESWTRLLELLPESAEHQAVRESLIINVLDAHMKAYNQLVDETGGKDIEHLRAAKATLDVYYADYVAIHGSRVAVSSAVQEKAHTLDVQLRWAEKQLEPESKAADGDEGAVSGGEAQGRGLAPVEDGRRDPSDRTSPGRGLVIAGAVTTALGLGAVAMIPIGVVRVQHAEELALDLFPDDTSEADRQGAQGVAIWASGAVLAPLLLGGGAAMLYLGIKRQRRGDRAASTLVPVVTPGFGGVAWQGRF